jgi:deoxycytidylate deaminase
MKYAQRVFDYIQPLAIQSGVGAARLAAAVVHNGRIVATGVNSMKSHPFQKKYGRNSESIFLHAETAAIQKFISRMGFIGDDCDLYVLRMKKDGPNHSYRYGLAKPCSGCQRCIAEFDIKNVYYTTDEGTIDYL